MKKKGLLTIAQVKEIKVRGQGRGQFQMERSLDAIFLRKIKRGGRDRDRDTKAVREDRKKKEILVN